MAKNIFSIDKTPICNPEKGFWFSYNPPGQGIPGNFSIPHDPLKVKDLQALRKQGITLIRDCILIGEHMFEPLSQKTMERLDNDFMACRQAGIKTIPRLMHNWGMSDYDADIDIVLIQIEQLKPLIKKYEDVIFYWHLGILGGTAEGGGSGSRYGDFIGITDKGRRLIEKFLEVLPKKRMLGVRFPSTKLQYLGLTYDDAVTEEESFSGTDKSRICYFSDCVLYDWRDTNFYSYGEECEGKLFFMEDSKYVIHSGEPFTDSEFSLRVNIEKYMEMYHLTTLALNQYDAAMTYKKWQDSGEYAMMQTRMGYSFYMRSIEADDISRSGYELHITAEMGNMGVAPIVNPRDIAIILRNEQTNEEVKILVEMKGKSQLFFPQPQEVKEFNLSVSLPSGMKSGRYGLLISFPDPCETISNRPEYSIRLYNSDMWEENTGYHKTGLVIEVSE